MQKVKVQSVSATRETKAKTKEPLAEQVIPLNAQRKRNWMALNDEQLVAYAQQFVDEKNVRNRNSLEKKDSGLCQVLRKRKLFYRLNIDELPRNWQAMPDVEIIKYTQELMKKRGITGRTELIKVDSGLHEILRKRKLLDKVGFVEKLRNWASMSNDEIVAYAKKFMGNRGIYGRSELKKINSILYTVLRTRKLLDIIEFIEKRRNWRFMSNNEILEYSRIFIMGEKIEGRANLQKRNCGLYDILHKRGLIDKIRFKMDKRNWASMSNDEIVAYTKKFINENRIGTRSHLQEKDNGLHLILRRRKLLDKVGLESKRRDWKIMGDDEIVAYTKRYIKQNKIKIRSILCKEDGSLYAILLKRNLLDRVFSDLEKNVLHTGIGEIIDALQQFRAEDAA